jgi:hypothetical protein
MPLYKDAKLNTAEAEPLFPGTQQHSVISDLEIAKDYLLNVRITLLST